VLAVGDDLVVVRYRDPSGTTVYTGLPRSASDFADTNGDGVGDLARTDFQLIKMLRQDGTVRWSGGSKTVVRGS
jgi:hypothetical protein